MSADVPSTSRSYWTPANLLLHSDDTNHCFPASSPTLTINPDLPSAFRSSFSTVSRIAAATPALDITVHVPDALSSINLTTVNSSDVDSICACYYCDRTFTSHIGLVDHLQIHYTKVGLEHQPTFAASSSTTLTPPCTFSPRMCLLGQIRIQENLRQTTAGYTTAHLHYTTKSPIANTRSPPPTQAGSVLLDSYSIRVLCCMCDPNLRLSRAPSAVAGKTADWRLNSFHAVSPVVCVCVCVE
nr:unnamed protein product [Spirometra erinaceieuropaei]